MVSMLRTSRNLLTETEILVQLPPGWQFDTGRIWREWTFQTYIQGLEFVNRVAAQAEEQNHHPDIHLFYCQVRVAFWTHDRGGVTGVDLLAAQEVNALCETLGMA